MNKLILVACFGVFFTSPATAEQKLSVDPNGTVKIAASVNDVTRITVLGDRIRRIIKDETSFQEMNDETTGDIFLRYAGPKDKLVPETGYIITEAGTTIGYEITPKANLDAETVVINVKGQLAPQESRTSAGGSAPTGGFELAAGEAGGGYASQLVAVAKAAIDKHIGGKAAPNRGHGTVIASETSSGMRARVLVASGGSKGKYVRPQDFYNSKTLAVWVQRNSLAPRQSAWVIVVEKH
ncbi:TraK domain-containing protein [Celeribacter naphthalenivorans]|uniref:TraK domain-containing protein n=1 Tax=Celeribacter naphthalenivorans TaxID=1614694 RepID=UPI001CFB10BC|nr:type-F conjugative transfer system secretin TraK [Celeribacter naphthalenivorans]